MELDRLVVFLRVAEASSFSVAASRLGVRRSSVSRSVAALERSLGVQVFHRTTRSVALTTAGRLLFDDVTPHIAALEDTIARLPEREEAPSGVIVLSASNDLAATLLPDILAAFTQRYPSVTPDVRVTNRRVDLVAEGFDAALRIGRGRLEDSSLVGRKLSAVEAHVVASPSYLARFGTPRSVEEAAEHKWILFHNMKVPGVVPSKARVAIIGDDVLFLRRAVMAGMGLGVVPSFLTREDVAAGRLVRVLPRVSLGEGGLHLVFPAGRHLPRKVRALRDFLVEHFQAFPMVGRAPPPAP